EQVAVVGNSIVVAGNFSGQLELDSHTLVSAGDNDLFVAALDPSDGRVRWATSFGGSGDEVLVSMDAAGGDYYLTGYVTGPVDFGGGMLPASGVQAFVLRVGPR